MSTGHPAVTAPATTNLMKFLRFAFKRWLLLSSSLLPFIVLPLKPFLLRLLLRFRFLLRLCLRPSPRTRRRYQNTIATSENTKMIVETALISGVMPRRSRPQISSGRVLSRPMRKKLTAISSIESVKISSAAPMMGSFKLGTVMRQNVCQ